VRSVRRRTTREGTIVTLPPGPTTLPAVQGARTLLGRRRAMQRLRDRYGDAFTIHVPVFGRAVVISDPAEIKQLFLACPGVAGHPTPSPGREPRPLLVLPANLREAQQPPTLPPPAVPWPPAGRVRDDRRNRDRPRNPDLAARAPVPHVAVDHAHHAQRHPA